VCVFVFVCVRDRPKKQRIKEGKRTKDLACVRVCAGKRAKEAQRGKKEGRKRRVKNPTAEGKERRQAASELRPQKE